MHAYDNFFDYRKRSFLNFFDIFLETLNLILQLFDLLVVIVFFFNLLNLLIKLIY